MLKICLVLGLLALGSVSARQLAGGHTIIDLGADATSLEMKDLMDSAHFAAERICHMRNSPVHMKFMQLTEATKQVVQGMNYRMKIRLGATDCLKSEGELSACLQSPQPHHDKIICEVTVWSRPWLQEAQRMQMVGQPNCQDE